MKFKSKILVFVLLLVGICLIPVEEAIGQGKRKVIQLSGIILGEDGVSGVPGVHIYVPKAGRGTTSNPVGYFSMAVLEGDSVVISAIGFEKRSFIVPSGTSDKLTVIEELVTDITYLEAVEIVPFPTEQLFKEAILALNVPLNDNVIDNDHYNADLLAYMAANAPMGAEANYFNYINNQLYFQQDRFGPRMNPLLNPFNWGRLIQSIKNGDFKKKN